MSTLAMPASKLNTRLRSLDTAMKGQSSQALTIQNYCLSVAQQPSVNLSKFPQLKQYGDGINQGLVKAQAHANLYLNNILPDIINNATSMSNYYALHQAVPTALPPGSSVADWTQTLQALQQQASAYQTSAASVASRLKQLRDDLSNDVKTFKTFVQDLNTAVGGDNGVLANISKQLGTIQSKIDGAIAGIALSGLAILGGVFLTCVGAIADFVTAGTSTPLVLGGVALIAGGAGGEVAAALTLKGLYDVQSKLLREQAELKSEVKASAGLSSGLDTFVNGAAASAQAALDMQNAWSLLSGDLGSLASDLNNGIVTTGFLRTLFLIPANKLLPQVQQDVTVIKNQLTGVKQLIAPAGTTIGPFAVSTAQSAAA